MESAVIHHRPLSDAAGQQAGQFDEFAELMTRELENDTWPSLPDDIDVAAAANVLTAADRRALAALGSSDELVRKILAPLEKHEPMETIQACDAPTMHAAEAIAPHVDGPEEGQDALKLTQLISRFHSVQDCESTIEFTSRFRKVRELGRGGQGVVYLAKCQQELDGEQALKVYSPVPYGSAEAYREDMQRLLHVASQVHRIHHNNLVDVRRFSDERGIFLMVMQWIDGSDLRRLLEPQLLDDLHRYAQPEHAAYCDNVIYANSAEGRLCLQPLQAVTIIEKCLKGLGALHSKKIVHADIKPSNIMLDCNGSIRLIDIGSAFCYDNSPPQRNWTPDYAPPEFLEKRVWTPQSDLASLGYVLIELLCGRPDVAGPCLVDKSTRESDAIRDKHLLAAKRSLPERLPELLPANVIRCDRLMSLCRKLIDPNPERRFANAHAAIDGHYAGTWNIQREIINAGLGVHTASAIQRWLTAVKQARWNSKNDRGAP